MAKKPKPAPQAKPLRPKQELFCQRYVEGAGPKKTRFNGTQAALEAGYSEKTAYSIAHENLKKPEIVERISELADRAGVTKDACLRVIADGLKATVVGSKLDKKKQLINAVVPDRKTRLRSAELGLKVHGGIEGASPPGGQTQVNIFAGDKWLEAMSAFHKSKQQQPPAA